MKEQREEDKEMEEFLEQNKVDGGAWQLEELVPELIARKRMSQFQKTKGSEGKKEVRRWSTQEMKDQPSSSMLEDTEKMIGWRAMSQLEVDECRTKNASDIDGGFKLDLCTVEDSKRGAYRGRNKLLGWSPVPYKVCRKLN